MSTQLAGKTREAAFFQREKSDVSVMIAAPLDSVWVWRSGKANRGSLVASPALFVSPTLDAGAFQTRLLTGTFGLHVSDHIAVVQNSSRLRHAKLLESESLLRVSTPRWQPEDLLRASSQPLRR